MFADESAHQYGSDFFCDEDCIWHGEEIHKDVYFWVVWRTDEIIAKVWTISALRLLCVSEVYCETWAKLDRFRFTS